MVGATVSGMGILTSKRKGDNVEGVGDGGEDVGFGGSLLTLNGDNEPESSVDAKDTLFLKELRAKAKVGGSWEWSMARGRTGWG